VPDSRLKKSYNHNLKADKEYALMKIRDISSDSKVDCQNFINYGDKGHSLTYFIGNQNIPKFVKESLIT